MSEMLKLIRERRSVRTFEKTPVKKEDLEALKEYMKEIDNPFDIPVSFVLLNAKEEGLTSPVLSGEEWYIAGIVEKKPYADVAYGYSFEKLVLYAWSLGIGTVWIGGTMKRENFERACGLKEGEMMPCVTPVGYPAKKLSMKEAMMRKGVGADSRLPEDSLFFDGEWGRALPGADEDEALEAVRWAPSAVNKQPWRVILKDDTYHFYEKKDRGYVHENTGDLQKIDVGIALCHFAKMLEEQGKAFGITVSDPEITIPDGVEYIASVR